jgi:hypothetical protein
MVEWIGAQARPLRVAFSRVFGSKSKEFGSPSLRVAGLCDAKEGVQWHAGYDPDDDQQRAGVNLEGMQYDDWPIARLLAAELKEPGLPKVVMANPGVHDVVLLLEREFWRIQSRPRIVEGNIASTPLPLGELTPAVWQECVREAYDCLDPRRRRRGRATQVVTLSTGEQVEGEVSPHLMLRWRAEAPTEWEPFLRDARQRLEPLHDWARRRASRPIRF